MEEKEEREKRIGSCCCSFRRVGMRMKKMKREERGWGIRASIFVDRRPFCFVGPSLKTLAGNDL